MPLSVIATIIAKPAHGEAVRQALREVQPPSRAEAGCRQYDLHADPANPLRLVMIERWDDENALSAHMATPHFIRLQGAIDGKVESVDIARLDLIA